MLEDRLLLYRAQRGDRQAFDRLYEKHLDALLTVAMSLLGRSGDAQDAVQEVFTALMESLATVRLHGSLRGYLAVCVANRCRDLLRRRCRCGTEAEAARVADDPEPLALAIRAEQVRRAEQALGRLPYEQREAVVLHIQAGLTFRAMARALQVPLGTVQSRYRYGLNSLKAELNGEDRI
jgi:RNA polymerase sigma-70 factor (ECF subfamily)